MMRYWALTDTGCVRPENQDAWHVRTVAGEGGTEILTAVVCDGMGGARAGNVASGLGVDLFTDTLCGELRTVDDAENAVPGAVAAANKAIYERSVSAEEYSGMGTTLVAAVTDGRKTLVVNIGDSRCYLIRDKLIRQITKDHSLVQDLVDRGEIDRADAWLHPQRNYITRALGTDETVEADRFHLILEPEDVLLLCTDGLRRGYLHRRPADDEHRSGAGRAGQRDADPADRGSGSPDRRASRIKDGQKNGQYG